MARILFLLLVFVIAQPIQAAEPIGTIIEIEGDVYTSSNQNPEKKPYKIDDPVYLSSLVQTGPGSKAHILFVDDTEITLGENTELLVDEYIYDPNSNDSSKGVFNVFRGTFLFVSGLISKREKPDVAIKTAYGSIGLRGTTVWGGDMDGEYGVLVQDGEVEVVNEGGRIIVPKGNGTFIKNRHERPRPPKIWPKAKTDRAVKAIALKHREQIRQRIAEHKRKNAERRQKWKERMLERREKLQELKDKRQEKIQDLKDKRSEVRDNVRDKRSEVRDNVRDKRSEVRDNVRDKRSEARDNVRDKRGEVRDNVRDKRGEVRQNRNERAKKRVKKRRDSR